METFSLRIGAGSIGADGVHLAPGSLIRQITGFYTLY
jgi:hypothetical protein